MQQGYPNLAWLNLLWAAKEAPKTKCVGFSVQAEFPIRIVIDSQPSPPPPFGERMGKGIQNGDPDDRMCAIADNKKFIKISSIKYNVQICLLNVLFFIFTSFGKKILYISSEIVDKLDENYFFYFFFVLYCVVHSF